MRRLHLLSALLLPLLPPAAAGQDLIASSYVLDVAFSPQGRSMTGRATVHFEIPPAIPEKLVFYLHGELSVDAAQIGGVPVPVSQARVFYRSDYSLIATRVEASLAGHDLEAGLVVDYSGAFLKAAQF